MNKYRDRFIELVIGTQGVGKTWVTVNYAEAYTKKHQQPAIVLDTNYEKAYRHWKEVPLAQVPYLRGEGCYRVSPVDERGKHTNNKDLILKYMLEYSRNCLIIAEDINNYIIREDDDIIKTLVNVRHKGVDLILHLQSLGAAFPRILANMKWIRFYKQTEKVDRIKGKLSNIETLYIAEYIIENEMKAGNFRYYLYIDYLKNGIKGASKHQIKQATRTYLEKNMNMVKKEIFPKIRRTKDTPVAREDALNWFLKDRNYFQPYF